MFRRQLEESFGPFSEAYEEEKFDPNKRFLLICEGASTEKHYFESFPVPSKTIEVIGGFPGGKKYLVNKAIEIAGREKYEDHEVWCIFDYDVQYGKEAQESDFNEAITLARSRGFHVAFSNDCFELWFLLHHQFITCQHHRDEYFEKLSDCWKPFLNGKSYGTHGKNPKYAKDIYAHLLPHQAVAIKNARNLHALYLAQPRPYHAMNPCTTVYQLVETLNMYLKN